MLSDLTWISVFGCRSAERHRSQRSGGSPYRRRQRLIRQAERMSSLLPGKRARLILMRLQVRPHASISSTHLLDQAVKLTVQTGGMVQLPVLMIAGGFSGKPEWRAI